MVHAGGRPPKYKKTGEGIEAFNTKVEEYFDECDKTNKPYTMSGLAYHLGMDRMSLFNYSKDEEFFYTIKMARNRIEKYIEENSLTGKCNVTASIFNLKNNFGWKDKQEIDNRVSGDMSMTIRYVKSDNKKEE